MMIKSTQFIVQTNQWPHLFFCVKCYSLAKKHKGRKIAHQYKHVHESKLIQTDPGQGKFELGKISCERLHPLFVLFTPLFTHL